MTTRYFLQHNIAWIQNSPPCFYLQKSFGIFVGSSHTEILHAAMPAKDHIRTKKYLP